MAVALNHTIIHAQDREVSAAFFTRIFGLPDAVPFSVFLGVELTNGVTLDFHGPFETLTPTHYAFLITEPEFDEIYGRIMAEGIEHWADPMQSEAGVINTHDGGRGVYFCDPSGHLLEIITRPYGG